MFLRNCRLISIIHDVATATEVDESNYNVVDIYILFWWQWNTWQLHTNIQILWCKTNTKIYFWNLRAVLKESPESNVEGHTRTYASVRRFNKDAIVPAQGLYFVRTLKKIYRVITAPHCIHIPGNIPHNKYAIIPPVSAPCFLHQTVSSKVLTYCSMIRAQTKQKIFVYVSWDALHLSWVASLIFSSSSRWWQL